MLLTLRPRRGLALGVSLAATIFCGDGRATPSAQGSPEPLTPQEGRDAIAALIDLLGQHYVLPEDGYRIMDLMEANQALGRYEEVSDEGDFARLVTEDLRSINGDRHLMLYPAPRSAVSGGGHYSLEMLRSRGAQGNYGFTKAEILAGNVGILRLSNLSLDELYEESCLAASAAMSFVANVDALIVDLRGNPGGGARISRYLSSYFFEEEPVHLNDYYFRTGDQTLEYWTLASIPGKRLPDVPLFILLNADTFSAAEGFAYNLKHLGRATVVGESSGGGSHGGAVHAATSRFRAYVPFSRSIHPVTRTDFEGVGVQPDIAVDSEMALSVAHLAAVDAILQQTSSQEDRTRYKALRSELDNRIDADAGRGKSTASARGPEESIRQGALELLGNAGAHSASIGVYSDGREYSGHFGELDPGVGNPPTDDTLYAIASVTKTMTGFLTAQAVLDGLIDPTDDVRDFLDGDFPNLAHDGDPIQVRHLLTHSSLLPAELVGVEGFLQAGDISGALDFVSRYSKEDFLNDLGSIELGAAPGSGYLYSSNGANLMGYVLESIYEKSYETLLNEHIFAKAGMRSTVLELDQEQRARLSNGYDGQGKRTPEQPRFLLGADGYLKSTLPDMLRYMRFLLADDNEVARESWRVMNESAAPMGYFWQIEERPESILFKHAGTAIGTTTWIIIEPEARLGVVLVISSRFQGSNDLLHDAAIELMRRLRL